MEITWIMGLCVDTNVRTLVGSTFRFNVDYLLKKLPFEAYFKDNMGIIS